MCVFGVGSCEGKDSWEMGKERWGFKKKNREGKAVNHLLCLRRHIEIPIRSHNTVLHKSWETFYCVCAFVCVCIEHVYTQSAHICE